MQFDLKTRLRQPMVRLAVLFLALAAALAFSAPAHAATVLNRFQRTCNVIVGCSPFEQVNGPYQPSVGSECVTSSWSGEGGQYYLPPRHRC